MTLSDRAISFVIKASDEINNISKKTSSLIIPALITGEILKFYGFNEELIAAGYLQNIVKTSNYTIEEISRIFGGRILSLILTSSNFSDNEFTYEARSNEIKQIKTLPVNNKAVILAEKIMLLETKEKEMWNNNGGSLLQNTDKFLERKKYYESILASLEFEADEEILCKLLDRMHQNILNVFCEEREIKKEALTEPVLSNDIRNISQLQKLKNIVSSPGPFIINFTSEQVVKEENINTIFDNFSVSNNFKIKVSSLDNIFLEKNLLNFSERNMLILAELELGFLTEVSAEKDILILDSNIFNRLTLLDRLLKRNIINHHDYILYIMYFKVNVNYVLMNINNNQDITINKITNCINSLKTYKFQIENQTLSNDFKYKIFDALLPIMRKEYVSELKLILEKKI